MGTSYSKSYSPGSISGAGPVGTDVEDIRDQVHALNESVQRQLEEVDQRYMELYECHERNKEQWTQQLQSIEQRMTIMYNYFKQMWSGGSSSSAQPLPPLPPPPLPQPFPHYHTSGDENNGISDINDDQYSQLLGFFFFKNYIVIIFFISFIIETFYFK